MYHEARTFFCTPLVESSDLGFGTNYPKKVPMKFFNLEACADRFARFRRYTFQNSKLRKYTISWKKHQHTRTFVCTRPYSHTKLRSHDMPPVQIRRENSDLEPGVDRFVEFDRNRAQKLKTLN